MWEDLAERCSMGHLFDELDACILIVISIQILRDCETFTFEMIFATFGIQDVEKKDSLQTSAQNSTSELFELFEFV